MPRSPASKSASTPAPKEAKSKRTPEQIAKAKARAKDTTPVRPADARMTQFEKARQINLAKLHKAKHANGEMIKATSGLERPLTDKQKIFIKIWAEGESLLSASYRAGYVDGGHQAYEMAKNPRILALYHAEKKLYEEAGQITRRDVMNGFKEAAEMAKVQGESLALTSAWREIGKMAGYYEPVKRQLDITINDQSTMGKLTRMSDAELLKLVQNDPNVMDVAFREVVAAETEDDRVLGT